MRPKVTALSASHESSVLWHCGTATVGTTYALQSVKASPGQQQRAHGAVLDLGARHADGQHDGLALVESKHLAQASYGRKVKKRDDTWVQAGTSGLDGKRVT